MCFRLDWPLRRSVEWWITEWRNEGLRSDGMAELYACHAELLRDTIEHI